MRGGVVEDGAGLSGMCRRQHRTQHQPAAANLREQRELVVERRQAGTQRRRLPRHVGGDRRRGQLAQRHPRHRRGQRVAAEGGAVRAELHGLGDLRPGQQRADREAAAQRLGQGHDVGSDLVLPVREQGAGAAHAALDLVQHQQRAVVIAQGPHLRQEARRRRHHPALALHRLQHHRGHIAGGHRRFQLHDVVEVDVAETTGQRLVAFLVLGLRGGGHRGQGAAVETAAESDDHPPLRRPALGGGPLAHQLDRRLVGLGAGIAQVRLLREARGHHQFLDQAQRRLAIEHVAGVPQLVGLFEQRRLQVRIVVAEPAHGDAGGQVDVVAPLAVPHPRALAALQHQLARTVDRQRVALAEGDQLRGGKSGHRGSPAGKAPIIRPPAAHGRGLPAAARTDGAAGAVPHRRRPRAPQQPHHAVARHVGGTSVPTRQRYGVGAEAPPTGGSPAAASHPIRTPPAAARAPATARRLG
ncbi:hypothetical protein NB717_003745 [Xanthomonas sacchari]|nr:hypothetical protein [Xanthomonas sacchari]